MKTLDVLNENIERFIKRYYLGKLIKGVIISLSLILFLIFSIVFIEYLLWLNSSIRLVFFIISICSILFIFYKFIFLPILWIFNYKRTLSKYNAAILIGEHFNSIDDKLLNLLQLSSKNINDPLIEASINQKSSLFNTIDFSNAINLKLNFKYLKFLIIPLFIVLFSLIFTSFKWFDDGFNRVVNFNTEYIAPQPFYFKIKNDSLSVLKNEDFKLLVYTEGDYIPENISISFNDTQLFLKREHNNLFSYQFTDVDIPVDFQLLSGNIRSLNYTLNVQNTPKIQSIDYHITYPSYIKKEQEIVPATDNLIFPEGTSIRFKAKSVFTNKISLTINNSDKNMVFSDPYFYYTDVLSNNTLYTFSSSNNIISNYESLSYSVKVLKDDYPKIDVTKITDSINNTLKFKGTISDDYGFSKFQLVYYNIESPNEKNYFLFKTNTNSLQSFLLNFPDQLNLDKGKSYKLYFELFDNDIINGFKSVKSESFSYNQFSKIEELSNNLQNQNSFINNLENQFNKSQINNKEFDDLSKDNIVKKRLDFNDKLKFDKLLKNQLDQQKLLKDINKQLSDNLKKFKNENSSEPFNKDLEDRLEDNEKQLSKNDELLKELNKLKDEINSEEFKQKMDELSKQKKNNERSLKQILELTKRFYVTKKAEKLSFELDELSKQQNSDSNIDKNEQQELQEKFNSLQKELDSLEYRNKQLKKPIKLERDAFLEDEINFNQKKSSEALDQNKSNEAQQQQNKASKKLKKMSDMLK